MLDTLMEFLNLAEIFLGNKQEVLFKEIKFVSNP